ncbi:hypothetical protein PG997_010264 [Apiospora hydei]|uniref:Transcription factor domain-containing protein n=1 Tax=Apiospora hydei TaxID=1337664 RepID=A0ABR1VWH3_9PEZI
MTVTHRFQDCVSFEPSQTVNMAWLLEDEAYLHSVLLVASAMWEEGPTKSKRGCHQSTRTGHYMNKTLASLREGLSPTSTDPTNGHPGVSSPTADVINDDQEATSTSSSLRDSRISVVATLVILSTLAGDTRALQAHVAGLTQMVRLRGGMKRIRQNPALYAKLRRVDVLWSLYCGEQPLFLPSYHDIASYEPYDDSCLGQQQSVDYRFGYPLVSPPLITKPISRLPLQPCKTLQTLIGADEGRLLAIFRAQQKISRRLNAALATGQPLAEAEFRDLVSESQCGLVALRGRCATIPAECLRLALLVILTTTMNLPSPAAQGSSPLTTGDEAAAAAKEDGARKFEACVRSLEIPSPSPSPSSAASSEDESDDDDLEPDFLLWLLLVGAVSLYGVDRAWLRELWRYHVVPRNLTCWDEVAARLRRRWVWVDAVHDGLGRHAFEVLTFGRRQTTAAAQEEGKDGDGGMGTVDGPRGCCGRVGGRYVLFGYR